MYHTMDFWNGGGDLNEFRAKLEVFRKRADDTVNYAAVIIDPFYTIRFTDDNPPQVLLKVNNTLQKIQNAELLQRGLDVFRNPNTKWKYRPGSNFVFVNIPIAPPPAPIGALGGDVAPPPPPPPHAPLHTSGGEQ